MNRIPEIGERVRFEGHLVGETRTATGTVVRIYPSFDPDTLAELPFEPERWHAAVRVDEIPDWWPYGDKDKFAPIIADLTPAHS